MGDVTTPFFHLNKDPKKYDDAVKVHQNRSWRETLSENGVE